MLAAMLMSIAMFSPTPSIGMHWLDPVDEVAPEVCEHHGLPVNAAIANSGNYGVAVCSDGSLQAFLP